MSFILSRWKEHPFEESFAQPNTHTLMRQIICLAETDISIEQVVKANVHAWKAVCYFDTISNVIERLVCAVFVVDAKKFRTCCQSAPHFKNVHFLSFFFLCLTQFTLISYVHINFHIRALNGTHINISLESLIKRKRNQSALTNTYTAMASSSHQLETEAKREKVKRSLEIVACLAIICSVL